MQVAKSYPDNGDFYPLIRSGMIYHLIFNKKHIPLIITS